MTYVVVAWYTPDYRELAAKFQSNLVAFGIPYQFLAYPKEVSSRNFRRRTHCKPEVVASSLKFNPDKAIVLMDVDCIVRDKIDDMIRPGLDVSMGFMARRKGNSLRASASSRVIVFHNTEKAKELAREWMKCCEEFNNLSDEQCLTIAITRVDGLMIERLPRKYVGIEESKADPDSIIVHRSENAKRRKFTYRVKSYFSS